MKVRDCSRSLKVGDLTPMRVTILYLIIGGLWILFSDKFLSLIIRDASKISEFQTFKGWFFIMVTAIILYFMIKKDMSIIKHSEEELIKSEARLRAIFEAADNISFIITDTLGENTHILEFSPGAEKIFGYTKEEVIGKKVAILHTRGDVMKFSSVQDEMRQHKIGFNGESTLVRKSGEIFPAMFTTYPIFDDNDNMVAAVGVSIDVTNYKTAEAELKDKSALLKATLDNISDIIRVMDTSFTILDCNQATLDRFDKTIDEIIGMKCYQLKGHDRPCEVCATPITYRTKEPAKIERFEEDTGKWFDIRTYPILDEQGNIVKVVEHIRDITERKVSERLQHESFEQNKNLLCEVIEYDKLKTEFFSNVSHELRTPLNVIFSTLQLMELYYRNGKIISTDEKVKKHFSVMKQNCNRLLRLINNLIDITRIDSGFLNLNLDNYDIVSVISDLANSVTGYVEKNDLTLEFKSDVDEKIMAFDIDKIERVILNLISNSIKFTKPGGHIILRAQDNGDSITISVKDDGVGIPMDKLETVFERFRQVDSSLSRGQEGSGIGLSLVKSLVEMHNGKVSVVSEEGKGAEFLIELPAHLIDDTNTAVVKSDVEQSNTEKVNIELSDIYQQVNNI